MMIIAPVSPVAPVYPVATVANVVAADLPLVADRVGSTVGVVAIEDACAQRKHG